MPSKTSGGKRATEKKHRERDAARNRKSDYGARWRAEYEKLGAPPSDAERAHAWLARVAVAVVKEAMQDMAMPPEQRRRDVMKFLEQASKVLDPAKLSEQLDELEQALEKLHAGNIETGEDSPPTPDTSLL